MSDEIKTQGFNANCPQPEPTANSLGSKPMTNIIKPKNPTTTVQLWTWEETAPEKLTQNEPQKEKSKKKPEA